MKIKRTLLLLIANLLDSIVSKKVKNIKTWNLIMEMVYQCIDKLSDSNPNDKDQLNEVFDSYKNSLYDIAIELAVNNAPSDEIKNKLININHG